MQEPEQFDPPIGIAETLEPGIQRIVAPNPSPMTWRGTNTYLLGQTDLAVIDPGPDDPRHLQAILGALGPGQRISHIFVTHAHVDHSPLSRTLSQATDAPILAFGDAQSGRSAVMQRLAAQGLAGGGEGVDAEFRPDQHLADGAFVTGPDWKVQALWTPGHFGNHLSFAFGDAVFCGDLVMSWASSLVSPPDGDLTDFMASCRRLKALGARVLYAGHGKPIEDPDARIDWLLDHRNAREAAILQALEQGPATAATLARHIYTETPPALLGAAERNVFAHLVDLTQQNRTSCEPELSATAVFGLPAKE